MGSNTHAMPSREMFETQVFFVLILERSSGYQEWDTKQANEDLVSGERGRNAIRVCCRL